MGRPDFPRAIMEFQERFPDETACLEYLAASRWPEGYRYPARDSERAWVLERRHLWECGDRHLDLAAKRLALGSDHRPARLPRDEPGRLIRRHAF